MKNNSGFNLIEVLIAMTILSMGILGLARLQITGAFSNRIGGKSTEAYNLAVLEMEKVLSADYDSPWLADINPGNNSTLLSNTNFDYKNIDADGNKVHWKGYDLVWNLGENIPISGTKTIIVQVMWDGGKRSRRLMGIKADIH